jgi:aldose 1-epimerase
MTAIELQSADLHLSVDPETGASVTGFWSERDAERFDWFLPGERACFPLVPYSNRIRDGRFRLGARDVALPLNFGDHPHSIHGHGWQAAWDVLESAPDRLLLSYRHSADEWPWAYAARQAFQLGVGGLAITLELENQSDSDMPAGIGLHPYFPLRDARLSAEVAGVWLTDDEVMPTERVSPPECWDLSGGAAVPGMAIDNGFDGWDGRAQIEWPESDAGLTIVAESPLINLVVFAPPGGDFFCVEPVSHMTDAFNLAARGMAETGMRVLAPGETLSAGVTFSPHRRSPAGR